jgi:hypothetical protein
VTDRSSAQTLLVGHSAPTTGCPAIVGIKSQQLLSQLTFDNTQSRNSCG